jgi:hypothetical protein
MNNKNYLLLVLLLMVPGGALLNVKNSSQLNSHYPLVKIKNQSTLLVGDVELELDLKIFTGGIKAGYDAIINAGSKCIKDLKAKETKILAGNIESSDAKHTCANADVSSKDNFSDQMNANVFFN